MIEIQDLGRVRGLSEKDVIVVTGARLQVGNLLQEEGHVHLKLLIPAIIRQDPVVHSLPKVDNTNLRRRLLDRNPRLRKPSMFVARTAVA